MFRQEDNHAPTHSQFAVRVAILGGVALVVFAAIFFRLWFLEVLSAESYLKEANANRIRSFPIQAQRGSILDRNGKVLVDTKSVPALQVRPDELFPRAEDRNRELRGLAKLIGMPFRKVKIEIREQSKLLPASPVTLKQKVNRKLVFGLRERQDKFPGISAEQIYVRDYPDGTLGAHLFGFVSEVSADQLEEPAYEGLEPGDQIGATGLESQYDSVLRGRNGAIKVPVNSFGEPSGRQQSRVEPEPGANLVTTLDKKVQAAGEAAIGRFNLPAAFVVMKVNDGSILGMGSTPTFDPEVYTPPVSTAKIKTLTNAPEAPLTDRAIQSGYPTGSTFKLITATAALESGVTTASAIFNDAGSLTVGDQQRTNAGGVVNGAVNMVSALKVSSDVYFYNLGVKMESVYEDGGKDDGPEILQDWASKYGFGSLTGIDLPGEGAGLLPTPEWRDKLYEQALQPDSLRGQGSDLPGGDRPPLVGRRQRQPRCRAGRPERHAAAARGRLRGVGQRWKRRPPAPRPAGRERAGAGDAGVRSGSSEKDRHLQGHPRHDHGGAAPSRERVRRHLRGHLRRLPDRDRRQDGHRREDRPGGPVVVRGDRSLRQSQVRRCGDRRAGWIRGGLGCARHA